eukprot:TRINITY_DN1420_c0_g1_i3.p1 TRINITY_DN1420_c0_g1~~TRINITY_DN1420_c0_g1_i3.p1  ORF type:complete len:420 (-),score=43.55 TRINITY_DN1420_c0_g1_i3:13-1272(-)
MMTIKNNKVLHLAPFLELTCSVMDDPIGARKIPVEKKKEKPHKNHNYLHKSMADPVILNPFEHLKQTNLTFISQTGQPCIMRSHRKRTASGLLCHSKPPKKPKISSSSSHSKCTFMQFPHEIIFLILEHLDPADLFVVGSVCKKLNRLQQDRVLRRLVVNRLSSMGEYFFTHECNEAAIRCCDKGLILEPENTTLLYTKGNALLGTDRWKEAIECYDLVLKKEPEHTKALNDKGNALVDANRYVEAMECYERALDIDPYFSIVWYNKGNMLYKQGMVGEAIKCFNKALELSPEDSECWYNKGHALRYQGDIDGAIDCFFKAIEIDPNDADAWNHRANALRVKGNFDLAVKCHNRAIKINPKDSNSWNYKGWTLHCQEKYLKAIGCYEKALNLNPKHYDAQRRKQIALEHTALILSKGLP